MKDVGQRLMTIQKFHSFIEENLDELYENRNHNIIHILLNDGCIPQLKEGMLGHNVMEGHSYFKGKEKIMKSKTQVVAMPSSSNASPPRLQLQGGRTPSSSVDRRKPAGGGGGGGDSFLNRSVLQSKETLSNISK